MNIDLIRNILNILFMALALAAVITYFVASDFKVFIYVCAAAIFSQAGGILYAVHVINNRRRNYDKRRNHKTRKPGL